MKPGTCRLRRDPLVLVLGIAALAASPAVRRPSLADEQFKWFYWIAPLLVVEPRSASSPRSPSATTSGSSVRSTEAGRVEQ